MPAPPQWDDASGGLAGYYTQGVLNPEGVEGAEGSQQKMKMVGFSPFGQGLFEGKKGMMQCGVNPQTGEYMTDAEGNARCWYVPTVAGGATQTVGNPGWGNGGFGSWINTDKDIVHYNGGIGLIGLSIPLLIGIALFAYRVYIMKRVNKGDEPGLLGKLVMPETWKLWGNTYKKQSHKMYEAEEEEPQQKKIDEALSLYRSLYISGNMSTSNLMRLEKLLGELENDGYDIIDDEENLTIMTPDGDDYSTENDNNYFAPGKKDYYVLENIGKAKYVVNYHDVDTPQE